MTTATKPARGPSINSHPDILIRVPWATEEHLKIAQKTEGVSTVKLVHGYGITATILPGFNQSEVRAELVQRLQLKTLD